MLDPDLFSKGILLGFAITIPVGPIGLLCIDRSLRHGKLSGFATGMGAALADTLYGLLATVGMSHVMGFLLGNERLFKIFGGCVLIVVAYKLFRSSPPVLIERTHGQKRPLLRLLIESFLLTLSNPMTILSYMAVYAGLGITATTQMEISSVLAGVFVSSSLWWFSLSFMTFFLRAKVELKYLNLFSKASSLIIALLGFSALVQGLFQFRI
jgi:threonine/homoserine/homoserine lactone efflux protein